MVEPSSRGERWGLLDPAAADPKLRDVFEQVLVLMSRSPDLDRPIPAGSPSVAQLLERHRVTSCVPLDDVEPAAREWLRVRHREIVAAQLRLRHAATTAIELLRADGIEALVLKGLATAELDYDEPRRRHSGDVDLAVAPDAIDDAVQALTAHGHLIQPTPFDPVLWYGRTLLTPSGVEIDLHTRLFRRSPLGDSLLDHPSTPLTSLPGAALRAEGRLVHAAGHFIISPPGTRRMNGFLDIGRLLERPDLDLDEARALAGDLGVEGLVGAGIRLEAELSRRTTVLDALASWAPPDWLERRTRLVAHRRLVLDHLGRYREVPAGQRLKYAPAWLFPTARQRRLLRDSGAAAASRVAARLRPRARMSP